MSDIFDEVEESLRQDKMEGLWKRYRPFIYGAAALLVGAVALNEFVLRPQAEQARAERALAFENALTLLEEDNYTEAEAAFRELAEGNGKIAPLAAQYLAQTQYEGGGDSNGATRTLSSVAAVEGSPFERLSILKTAYYSVDTQSMSDLEATLGSLVEDEGPLGALARELIAAKAFETGDIARARTGFNPARIGAAVRSFIVARTITETSMSRSFMMAAASFGFMLEYSATSRRTSSVCEFSTRARRPSTASFSSSSRPCSNCNCSEARSISA